VPSGSITVSTDDQVIQGKDITGNITINGHARCKIRHCRIKYAGGNGVYVSNAQDFEITDCEFVNTAAAKGQNPGEHICIHLNRVGGTVNINRVTVRDAAGVYAHECAGRANLKGHNIRSPLSPLRGQLVQLNQTSGPIILEDFSAECDPDNSWPEDLINVWTCTNSIVIRRGLIDGCNSPVGVMVMVEDTPNVLVEDVDAVHHGNGAFGAYKPKSVNVTFRRCRAKDQIKSNQGRGKPSSDGGAGPCNFVSSPDSSGTRFEQIIYTNISSNLAWVTSRMAVMDWKPQNFTPREPIRNQFAWT
jgi:hypothetical protein